MVIVWKVHDVQDALKAVLADTLQAMLDSELDTHLGYDKYAIQQKQTTNSRNGHSRKSQYGDVELAVPRDREGTFTPIVVPKHQTAMVGIEDQIIALPSPRGAKRASAFRVLRRRNNRQTVPDSTGGMPTELGHSRGQVGERVKVGDPD